MLVCAFKAAFFIFAKFSHMIEIEAIVALRDMIVFFK